jgi:hypothetical protein
MTIYLNNIPTGLVKLSQDYINIKNNFSQLDITYGINHVPYSVALNNGLHTVVNMVNNVSKPTIIDDTGALYTRPFSGGGNTDLWYTPDSSGYEYQMTRTSENATLFNLFGKLTQNYIAADGSGAVGTQFYGGWTFLPGGLLYQYGSLWVSGGLPSSSGTVHFPILFTTASPTVQNIIISMTMISKDSGSSSNNTPSVQNNELDNGSFKWSAPSSGSGYLGFTWTALGL